MDLCEPSGCPGCKSLQGCLASKSSSGLSSDMIEKHKKIVRRPNMSSLKPHCAQRLLECRNSMRSSIASKTLSETWLKILCLSSDGPAWWEGPRVDEKRIREPVAIRRKKEVDNGVTIRSDRLIDYTTFGELSQLITDNLDLFQLVFQSKTAVSNVSNQLNLIRGPIAHCNPTDELEQDRLNLAVRTWFKIMS